jgi:hypothetical protein
VIALAACGGGSSPVPVGSRVGPALTAAFGAFDQARAPLRCAAQNGPKLPEETLKLGDHTWKLAGNSLAISGTDSMTIGVIADAGGAAAPTIAALGRLRAKLARADLVIALGGMGTSQSELEATLGTLAENAKGPVIAIAGDLESAPALAQAIAKLRARKQVVIDGRLARTIELPNATIATLPGVGALARSVAGADGCGYSAVDADAMFRELTKSKGLRIVATHEAPRITVDGEAAGSLAATPGAGHEIDLVLHGPVVGGASRARTGRRDGGAVPLTPGTSDATTRLPARHTSSAGLLEITGTTWKWTPLSDEP